MGAGYSLQSSTNDKTGSSLGLNSSFGGLNKTSTGIDPNMALLAAVVGLGLFMWGRK